MRTDWRISSFNGVLLAAYFIPTWAIVAFRIMISPIQGLYERPNVSVALFISDHLQLAALTTVRFAWLLALGKLTVVGFFAIFVVLIPNVFRYLVKPLLRVMVAEPLSTGSAVAEA